MELDKSIEYIIRYLSPKYRIPNSLRRKWSIYRNLMNIRKPEPMPEEILRLQDNVLRQFVSQVIVNDEMFEEIRPNLKLYKGDIIFLKADAIINSTDFEKNGFFLPSEDGGLDEVIHIFSGTRLKLEIDRLKKEEKIIEGEPLLTPAYNLPASYIFHIELPTANSPPTEEQYGSLRNQIALSLKRAKEMELKSIAIPAIGTGSRGFSLREALENIMAVAENFLRNNELEIILIAYKERTLIQYREILNGNEIVIEDMDSRDDLLKMIREEDKKDYPEESVEEMIERLRNKWT